MAQPPLDPFEGYLEVLSVIQILQRKRQRLLAEFHSPGAGEEAEPAEFPGSDPDADSSFASSPVGPSQQDRADTQALIARVESGIFEAEALQLVYEERMEAALQGAADHADALRSLLVSISERLAEMQTWISDAVSGLSGEDLEEWRRLKSDYHRLQTQIGLKLPPQEP